MLIPAPPGSRRQRSFVVDHMVETVLFLYKYNGVIIPCPTGRRNARRQKARRPEHPGRRAKTGTSTLFTFPQPAQHPPRNPAARTKQSQWRDRAPARLLGPFPNTWSRSFQHRSGSSIRSFPQRQGVPGIAYDSQKHLLKNMKKGRQKNSAHLYPLHDYMFIMPLQPYRHTSLSLLQSCSMGAFFENVPAICKNHSLLLYFTPS